MRERERSNSEKLTHLAVALALFLATPALAQNNGMQRISLAFSETAQLGSLLFGQGVAEVATTSTGTTTAGGTVTWVKYHEQTDNLGMRHVYYRQQFRHPQLGSEARITGTSIALHLAPEGHLRWAGGAQVADILRVRPATVLTRQQAFAAARAAAALWPGFTPGDPATWPPGMMSELRDRVELVLTVDRDRELRPVWRVPMPDAAGAPFMLLLDGSTGSLERVVGGTQDAGYKRYVDCSPDSPLSVDARARPQNSAVHGGDLRPPQENVNANPWTSDNETSCGAAGANVPCSHEAVWSGTTGAYAQVEVYHGSTASTRCQDPTHSSNHGFYMRVGLKEVAGEVTYDTYEDPALLYRKNAGDAMLFTRRTMEQLYSMSSRCGFDDACGVARVVVDAAPYCGSLHGKDNAGFMYDEAWSSQAPTDGLVICPSSNPGVLNTMSAAQDIIAHEWGHGVSKHSPVDFYGQCTSPPNPVDACELSEGFADFVGHWVEWATQPDPPPGQDWDWETREWIMGEDWNPDSPRLRRADEYDAHTCNEPDVNDRYRESIHADDLLMCERGNTTETYHSAGNRLNVAFMLLSDGGANPGCTVFDNCDVSVDGIGYHDAAQILLRVLEVQADEATSTWDEIPYLARAAAYDLHHGEDPEDPCATTIQESVITAFKAVGYPVNLPEPPFYCPGDDECPPYCAE